MLGKALDARLSDLLHADDVTQASRFPGRAPGRQPVHTVFVPADQYHHGIVAEWGTAAGDLLQEHGPIPGYDEAEWDELEPLVHEKLQTEPVEDLRIDLSDGSRVLSDADHTACVVQVARSLAASHADRSAPLSIGIRVPGLHAASRQRAVRTLDLLLDELLRAARAHVDRLGEGLIPDGFRLTLPDVRSVVQVVAMVELCATMEAEYGLAPGKLRFDLEVANPQAIVGPDGSATIAQMIHSAAGRCAGLQYRHSDYAAAMLMIGAAGLPDPSADHARLVMLAAAAGTGVPVCDSAVELARPANSAEEVREAWQLHGAAVGRGLRQGILRGTDLYPLQLASRYAATYSFYRRGLPTALEALTRSLSANRKSPAAGPARISSLAAFLARGLDAGAYDEGVLADVRGAGPSGLDRGELDQLARG